jgi:hypothetical protein
MTNDKTNVVAFPKKGEDDPFWDLLDWYEDIEDGVWPYSDAFLEKMQSVPMYGEIWKERQEYRRKQKRQDEEE